MHAFWNSFGQAGGEALAQALESNTTLEEVCVGNLMVGSTVRLKSSGETCTVKRAYSSGDIKVTKPDGSTQDDVKPSEFEWESQVPAFCAGLAASTSLLSVSAICAPYAKDVVC